MRLSPVLDRSAWSSEDLSTDESWVFHFDAADNLELRSALAEARGLVRDYAAVSASEFPLRRLIGRLAAVRDEVIWGRGVVLIRGLDFSGLTEDDLRLMFWGLGSHLGVGVSQNAAGDLVGDIRDTGRRFGDSSVRGYQTRAALPFHTDGPDLVALLCLSPGQAGGVSSIASSMSVFNEILENHRYVLGSLFKNYYLYLKSEHPDGGSPYCESQLFSEFEGWLSCRWVPGFVTQAAEISGVPLSDVDRYVIDLFQSLASADRHRVDMSFKAGDLQVLNNSTVLHARSAYRDDPDAGSERHLLRLWLNVVDGRPTDPALFSFYREGVPPQ